MPTSIATPATKVSRKQLIIAAGRAHLKAWLLAAEAHGTIYYNVQSVSRSGMNRKISLSTIIMARAEEPPCEMRAELVRLWPSIPDDKFNDIMRGQSGYSEALDIVARDWSFSWEARAFNVSGCGQDMVHHLVYTLAGMVFQSSRALPFTNEVRREAF
jgi:hypothetical protein